MLTEIYPSYWEVFLVFDRPTNDYLCTCIHTPFVNGKVVSYLGRICFAVLSIYAMQLDSNVVYVHGQNRFCFKFFKYSVVLILSDVIYEEIC